MKLRLPGRGLPGRRLPGRGSDGGFTLIELMVALMLAAIVSMSIMMISTQARMAYEETVKKVDVYNRFRYALQTLENDIKQWVPTSDLEFYQDGRGRSGKLNTHWDPGEEVTSGTDKFGSGLRDGGEFGKFEEFAYIKQHSYRSREPDQDDPDPKVHDAYQMYFQTLTYVDGAVRLALVEFFLADPQRAVSSTNRTPGPPGGEVVSKSDVSNMILMKVVRYYEISPDSILLQNETPVKRQVIELATNVTDFKIEYTVEPQLRQRSRRSGKLDFMTPEEDYRAPLERATRPTRIRKRGQRLQYLKRFGYGSVKINEYFDKATAFSGQRGDRNIGFNRGRHQPVRFGFQGNPNMQFAQLIPGDKIFIFTEGERAARAAGAGGAGNNLSQLIRFPAGDYTVKGNRSGLLELNEDIDSTEWAGQDQSGILYKAGYLPGALRVTLRIVDDKGQNPKTLQRVIWIRRRAR